MLRSINMGLSRTLSDSRVIINPSLSLRCRTVARCDRAWCLSQQRKDFHLCAIRGPGHALSSDSSSEQLPSSLAKVTFSPRSSYSILQILAVLIVLNAFVVLVILKILIVFATRVATSSTVRILLHCILPDRSILVLEHVWIILLEQFPFLFALIV